MYKLVVELTPSIPSFGKLNKNRVSILKLILVTRASGSQELLRN